MNGTAIFIRQFSSVCQMYCISNIELLIWPVNLILNFFIKVNSDVKRAYPATHGCFLFDKFEPPIHLCWMFRFIEKLYVNFYLTSLSAVNQSLNFFLWRVSVAIVKFLVYFTCFLRQVGKMDTPTNSTNLTVCASGSGRPVRLQTKKIPKKVILWDDIFHSGFMTR